MNLQRLKTSHAAAFWISSSGLIAHSPLPRETHSRPILRNIENNRWNLTILSCCDQRPFVGEYTRLSHMDASPAIHSSSVFLGFSFSCYPWWVFHQTWWDPCRNISVRERKGDDELTVIPPLRAQVYRESRMMLLSFLVRNKPSPCCSTNSKVHEISQESIVTDCFEGCWVHHKILRVDLSVLPKSV